MQRADLQKGRGWGDWTIELFTGNPTFRCWKKTSWVKLERAIWYILHYAFPPPFPSHVDVDVEGCSEKMTQMKHVPVLSLLWLWPINNTSPKNIQLRSPEAEKNILFIAKITWFLFLHSMCAFMWVLTCVCFGRGESPFLRDCSTTNAHQQSQCLQNHRHPNLCQQQYPNLMLGLRGLCNFLPFMASLILVIFMFVNNSIQIR